MKVNAFRASVK